MFTSGKCFKAAVSAEIRAYTDWRGLGTNLKFHKVTETVKQNSDFELALKIVKMMSANKLGHKQGAMLCSLASKLRHKSVGFTFNLQSSNANTRSVPFSKFQLLPQQEICEDYECTPRPLLEFRPFQLPGSTQNLDNQKPQDEANMYKHVQMEIKLIEMSHFVSFSCIINTIQHHSTVRFGDEFRTYRVLQKKTAMRQPSRQRIFPTPHPPDSMLLHSFAWHSLQKNSHFRSDAGMVRSTTLIAGARGHPG